MKFDAPTRDDLLALDAKYAQMQLLREAHERGESIPERAFFKALAGRFPGVLRELDTLPLEIVATRRLALGEAVSGGTVEPWMTWMVAYHGLMRAALWIKLRMAKQPDVTSERMDFLLRGVRNEFGFGVDKEFVMDALRPRAGRLNAMVLERLATMFGVSQTEIGKALFGRVRVINGG